MLDISRFSTRYSVRTMTDADVETFDKSFPPKEKQKLPGQIFG